ncbi:unnamed protein product [Eruca vesicaria subsp. sativa]|uniref:Uncharacterized protein n=1 Tax=Eruca vesicaria subsp. sativa TaxID=29727 RepID=A0ABC8L611_ERUVS|nr:unnamed protein product [Eruca vesicaria subsp. sativa]
MPLSDNNSSNDPMIRPVSISVDFPPESYSISKEEQLEWFNENAFFERKGSQKGIQPSTQNHNPNPNSSSQRISLNSKTSMIRLPKPQKTCFNEVTKRRNCRIARTLMIPKRIGSRLKSEPSSPKVSCIGRVRSKRCDRSRRMNRQKSGRTDSLKDKPVPVKKPGFLSTFRALFITGGGCKNISASGVHAPEKEVAVAARRSRDIRERLPPEVVGGSSPPRMSTGPRRSVDGEEPVLPGLGGVTRFKSGRRPDLFVEV